MDLGTFSVRGACSGFRNVFSPLSVLVQVAALRAQIDSGSPAASRPSPSALQRGPFAPSPEELVSMQAEEVAEDSWREQ